MEYKLELYKKKVGESQWEVKVNDQRIIFILKSPISTFTM